jgi:hypothetical protein
MTTELSTDRLILSMPSQVDYPAYVAFYSDADASTFYGGPLRPDGAWKRLAEDIGHWSLRGFGVWSLRDRKTAETLGGCGLWHPEGWPRRELTWWLLPSARGGGLATEASVRVIDHALSELAGPLRRADWHNGSVANGSSDSLSRTASSATSGGFPGAFETQPPGIVSWLAGNRVRVDPRTLQTLRERGFAQLQGRVPLSGVAGDDRRDLRRGRSGVISSSVARLSP